MDTPSDNSPNWDVIKTEYVCGNDSTEKLAEKYGLTWGSVQSRCHRGGWAEERRKMKERAKAEADHELMTSMAHEIASTNILDLSIANGLKRQIKMHLDKAAMAEATLEPHVLRTLGAAADHAQKVAQIAVGKATTISESNIAVQTQAPNYDELPTEDLLALRSARAIIDKLQGIPS
jgi:hypothetical protein